MSCSGAVRTRSLLLPLTPNPLTSEPAQKEIVIRIGQGGQHVLHIFSELGMEMLVKVAFAFSLGLQPNNYFHHPFSSTCNLLHDDGRMVGRWVGDMIIGWIYG